MIVLIALRFGAQHVRVDPQRAVEHDLQPTGQLRPLALGRLGRETAQIEVLTGPREVPIPRRDEESVYA